MLNSSASSPLERVAVLAAIDQGPSCIDVSYANYLTALLNISVGGDRVWTYQTCAEFGFYQTCDPNSSCPFTVVPWLDTLQSSLDLCQVLFNISSVEVENNIADSNIFYGGDHPDGIQPDIH